MEVTLSNPLAVPLKVEAVQLAVSFTPTPPVGAEGGADSTVSSPRAQAAPSGGAGTGVGLGVGTGTGAGARAGVGMGWVSMLASALLPPGGKPVRLVLSGRMDVPGTVVLLGVRASMAGISWSAPFAAAQGCGGGKAGGGAVSRARAAGAKDKPLPPSALCYSPGGVAQPGPGGAGVGGSLAVRVLPALPLLSAVLHGPDGPLVTCPTEDDLMGELNAFDMALTYGLHCMTAVSVYDSEFEATFCAGPIKFCLALCC